MIKGQIDPLFMHTDLATVPKVFVSALIHLASNNYWLQSTNGSVCCVMTLLVTCVVREPVEGGCR